MSDEQHDQFCKYMRIFSGRLVQSLVQSRQGDFAEQVCVPVSQNKLGSDWFNMRIDEIGEIAAHLKAHVKSYPPFSKLTVEFVLYTAEGKFLPLEAWILRVEENEIDDRINLDSQYHSLSVLLRSVNVAARMTPMHRLYVKKQNSDSFIVMYRLYTTDGISDMGPNARSRQLARLPSIFGTVYLDLIYRTSMHFDEAEKEEEEQNENFPGKPTLKDCEPVLPHKVKSEPELSKKLATSPSSPECSSLGETPRFGMGTSLKNEQEKKKSMDEIDLQTISDFPFRALLQSAYATKSAENLAESPFSPESHQNSAAAAEISAIPEENEEEEKENGGNRLQKSEDSFIELCGFGTSSSNIELGELINSLKIAPDIQTHTISKEQLENELAAFQKQQDDFKDFVEKINKIEDF
ncbi:unnamed protein product [Caenorhabditis angaria]|uniref:Autophagy-related protein 13 n=1 Tax=Caenorhabditis angaria TaxID=860376 RepID=A0A9P1INR2_9PELO|nr:unnamed protein product [Caenorhabditis angaria]